MREALIRYCTLFGSLALVSVAAVPILAVRSSSLGVPAPVGLGATSPVLALGAVLLAFALFAAVAAFVARILNIAVALFVAGWGFSVVALACGNVQSFLWSGGAPATQAIETLVSSVPVAVVVIVLFLSSGGLKELHGSDHPLARPTLGTLRAPQSLLFLAFGFIAVAASWGLLSSMRTGQVLGAVFVGCWVAGTVARLALPSAQPVLLFVGPVLCGGLVQLVLALGTSGDLADALVAGDYPRLLWVMPLDWVGGSLAGTAFGLGFAKMFFENSLAEKSSGSKEWGPAGSGS
ncbi:MAG: hypothetical protein VXY94_06805 [Planctomycetota bacterium]|nr:hypothetical protein [Planctomycetota bacterium]